MPSRKMLKEGAAAHKCEPLAPAYQGGREVFCDPFPSLIIQDEAHLLDESLGTFAGLFETMLEQLFVRASDLLGERVARSPFGARPVRLPKVVAATATVSVPQQQFGALYQRRHMHFPYPGTSIYRSFYAMPAVPTDPARRGLGGGGPRAPEIEAPWMRTYASIMTNGRNHTVTTVSVLAAYHLAITELWQDLLDDARRNAAVQRVLDSLGSRCSGRSRRVRSRCRRDGAPRSGMRVPSCDDSCGPDEMGNGQIGTIASFRGLARHMRWPAQWNERMLNFLRLHPLDLANDRAKRVPRATLSQRQNSD